MFWGMWAKIQQVHYISLSWEFMQVLLSQIESNLKVSHIQIRINGITDCNENSINFQPTASRKHTVIINLTVTKWKVEKIQRSETYKIMRINELTANSTEKYWNTFKKFRGPVIEWLNLIILRLIYPAAFQYREFSQPNLERFEYFQTKGKIYELDISHRSRGVHFLESVLWILDKNTLFVFILSLPI